MTTTARKVNWLTTATTAAPRIPKRSTNSASPTIVTMAATISP